MIWKSSVLFIIRSGIFCEISIFFQFKYVYRKWVMHQEPIPTDAHPNNWRGAHNRSQPELDIKYFPHEMQLPWLNNQCENNCFPFLYIEHFFGDENNNQHLPSGTIPIFWNWNLQQLSSTQVFKCVLDWCLGNSRIWGNALTRVTFCHERPLYKIFESKPRAQWSFWKVPHWGEEALGHWLWEPQSCHGDSQGCGR